MNDKAPKPPWAEEPSPLCDSKQEDPAIAAGFNDWPSFARDLERRLRHAHRLLETIRIDCMLDGPDGTLDPELLEQQLTELESTLTP